MTDITEHWSKRVMRLRNHSLVEAWIKTESERLVEFGWAGRAERTDCGHCGFPHDKHLLCLQSPYGLVYVGGEPYSVAMSNTESMIGFFEGLNTPGDFHWKKERFFTSRPDEVLIRFYSSYNNTPQEHVWVIPRNEWNTIVEQMALKSPT